MVQERRIVLAIDAMGGDGAPKVPIAGLDIALRTLKDVSFVVYGDNAVVGPIIEQYPSLANNIEFIHTTEVVTGDTKPSVALRAMPDSSMRKGIDGLLEKKADAFVSSGNTGALMAMSKIFLKTIAGIDRPAICTCIPTKQASAVMLDLGANTECTPENLLQFAIMGAAYGESLLKKSGKPRVAILNIGSELIKGKADLQEAYSLCEKLQGDFEFIGYIEPHEVLFDKADVIVTDGFTGNVWLKTAEGAAMVLYKECKSIVSKGGILTKLKALCMRSIMKQVFMKFDPRQYNGAMLLGLNGVVVKSHGAASAQEFAHAVEVAYNLAQYDLNNKISQRIVRAIADSDINGDSSRAEA